MKNIMLKFSTPSQFSIILFTYHILIIMVLYFMPRPEHSRPSQGQDQEIWTYSQCQVQGFTSLADVRWSKFLVRETCIQDAYTTTQVCRIRNMVDNGNNDVAVDTTIVLPVLTTWTSNQ